MDSGQVTNLFPVKLRAVVPVRDIQVVLANSIKPSAAKDKLLQIIRSLGINSKQDLGTIANSLIELESQRRKLLIEASRPKEYFDGTDFYLDVDLAAQNPKYKAYNKVLKKLLGFNKDYGNILQLSRFEKDSLSRALSLIMFATKKIVSTNPNLANPKSDSYRPENLFYSFLFTESMNFNDKIYKKNNEYFVRRSDVIDHYKKMNILLSGDPELDIAISKLEKDNRDILSWNDVADLTGISLNQASERAGLFICVTPQGDEFFGAIVPELNEVRKVGSLDIPVHYVVSLTGETLGQGYSRNSKVFLPADSLFLDEAIYEHNVAKYDAFIKSKLARPKIVEAPSLLMPLSLAFEAKSLDPTKIEEIFKEHTLAEELAHAYSDEYSRLMCTESITNDNHFYRIISSILRPNSDAARFYGELLRSFPDYSETISSGYLEIEGKAKSLVDSPLPMRSIIEIISPMLDPISGSSMLASNKAACYDISTLYLFKALSEELLDNGRELCSQIDWSKLLNSVVKGNVIAFKNSNWLDYVNKNIDSDGLNKLRKAWYEFFDSNLNSLDDFNKLVSSNRIQDAAKRIHETNFLTYDERESNLNLIIT